MKKSLSLRVQEGQRQDAGKHLARIDARDMKALGVRSGDPVLIHGARTAAARVEPSRMYDRGLSLVQMDGVLRENAGVGLDETVRVERAVGVHASRVAVLPVFSEGDGRRVHGASQILHAIQGFPLRAGNRFRVRFVGAGFRLYEVVEVRPGETGVVSASTVVQVVQADPRTEEKQRGTGVTYEDIGGLWEEVQRIREMIELPLKHPRLFTRLGIDPPRGVLLHGPPGTGKTLIAKAVANEAGIHFVSVNGPEIVNKFYGESEAQLRGLFEDAERHAPSILFLDEIDAIAPKRVEVTGEVEKRIVAQLLALMDGLRARGQVVVIGATNIPHVIDPALRRPGRFDREIATRVPDRNARLEILQIHTAGMPLAQDVDLAQLADLAHGYVGADLESLCREAALVRLRRIMETRDLFREEEGTGLEAELVIRMEDFLGAMKMVEPSAVREVLVEVPEVRWGDVGGLEEEKAALERLAEWPIRYRELYRHFTCPPARGILLTGPPGTGKTLLARALATETQRNFISVKGPELFSKWVGESEKGVRALFRTARAAAPSLVFFDEIDAMLSVRQGGGGDGRVTEKVISQFLTEVDGIEALGDVIVVAATNRRDLIDPAVLRAGRFDVELALGPPGPAARKQILAVHTRGLPLERKVDLDELARLTDGLVGADLAWLCRHAFRQTLEAYVQRSPARAGRPPFRATVKRAAFLRALELLRARKEEPGPEADGG